MPVGTIYCDNCGAANRAQATFCFSCGNRMSVASSPAYPPGPAGGAGIPNLSTFTGSIQAGYILNGRYRIVRLLGQGGMGAVYKAMDTRFGGRFVAVKEMSQSGLSPQELVEATEAFKREALMLAGLKHVNLPSIFDHFGEAGRWYLVMDFIEGETLENYVQSASGSTLAVSETLRIADQLCTVLDYLHERNPPIIFRDLKPANVMITPNLHVYLIDFGIARNFKPNQSRDTVAMGSPGFAPPEQYGKAQTSVRSDIYSLGATLHYCLTGVDPSIHPFQFAPVRSYNPQVPPMLDDLITRTVSIDPSNRPVTVAAVQQEIISISNSRKAAPPLQVGQHATPPPTQVWRIAQDELRKLGNWDIARMSNSALMHTSGVALALGTLGSAVFAMGISNGIAGLSLCGGALALFSITRAGIAGLNGMKRISRDGRSGWLVLGLVIGFMGLSTFFMCGVPLGLALVTFIYYSAGPGRNTP